MQSSHSLYFMLSLTCLSFALCSIMTVLFVFFYCFIFIPCVRFHDTPVDTCGDLQTTPQDPSFQTALT